MRAGIAAAAVLVLGALDGGAAAAERVDLELVLLADASRSIDNAEVRFQRQGYAAAITHPAIVATIMNGYDRRIAVTYVEWGDESSQEVVVPWTIIDGPESAAAFARALLDRPRLGYGANAIGSAIAAAHGLIESNQIDGHRKVIDISGDSANSYGGPPIAEARGAALAADITINGLAVLCHRESCSGPPVGYDLAAAFKSFIIGGLGSFVISADGTERFATAVRRKLLLEIAATTSAVPSSPHPPLVVRIHDRGPRPWYPFSLE